MELIQACTAARQCAETCLRRDCLRLKTCPTTWSCQSLDGDRLWVKRTSLRAANSLALSSATVRKVQSLSWVRSNSPYSSSPKTLGSRLWRKLFRKKTGSRPNTSATLLGTSKKRTDSAVRSNNFYFLGRLMWAVRPCCPPIRSPWRPVWALRAPPTK